MVNDNISYINKYYLNHADPCNFLSSHQFVTVTDTYYRFYTSNPSQPNRSVSYLQYSIKNNLLNLDYSTQNTGNNGLSNVYFTTCTISSNPNTLMFTNDIKYSDNFTNLLLQFLLLSFVLFYLPTKIIMRLFRKGAR